MKAFLMYKEADFDLQRKLPLHAQALTQDLELNTLFNAMALGDRFLFAVAKSAVLSSVHDLNTIRYRQEMLRDCLRNSSLVRDIYALAVEAIEREKKSYFGFFRDYPSTILHRSIEVLQMFVEMLKKLRHIADEYSGTFASEGFTTLFAMLTQELSDDYFARIQDHLRTLKFRDGMLMSAKLGQGNKGSNYILRQSQEKHQSWIERVFAERLPVYSFSIGERDESGARALSELNDRGVNLVANALAQSTDHILSFFTMLRTEMAFYIGCLNVHRQLVQQREPVSFPLLVASDEPTHTFQGLYDVCLALTMKQKVVGNALHADKKDLVFITGTNQGGKSTFLRSIGQAQLMMQCGMFVPAEFFSATICNGLFTHYKRKEDTTMKSGKLDEELSRMSDIVEHITPHSLLLFNESFAATNEREGSEIARQILCALLDKRIKVFFVTHLYELAHGFYEEKMENALFLRAERHGDGGRTFKITEGEPLPTSYGEDVYHKIFGTNS